MKLKEIKAYIKDNGAITLTIVRPPVLASVTVEVRWGEMPLVATGVAYCSATDEWNEHAGRGIAYGRAVNDLVRQIQALEKAKGRVRATTVNCRCEPAESPLSASAVKASEPTPITVSPALYSYLCINGVPQGPF